MRISLPERFQILHQRNFRLYWLGQLVSLTGLWMQTVAVSWVVLDLTHKSTLAVSINNFAVQFPALLLMLYGGLVADRYSRRQIMVVTQILLMVLALVVGTLLATGLITFWLLLLCSVMVGIVSAFDLPAQQALVPELVEPHEIP